VEQALGVDMLWTARVCGGTAIVRVSCGHRYGATKAHT